MEIATSTDGARMGPADLRTIVAEAVAAAEREANAGRIEFISPVTPLWLDVNEFQVQVAATNLIRNALAYSVPDSKIRVALDRDADCMVIVVENEGLVDTADGERSIFETFTRGRAAEGTPGSGLGLFIVRRVLEFHNGSLSWASEGGRVSFTMRIPSAAVGVQPCAS